MRHTRFSKDRVKTKRGSVRSRHSKNQGRGKEVTPTVGLRPAESTAGFQPMPCPISTSLLLHTHGSGHLCVGVSICLSPSGRLWGTPGVQRTAPGPCVLGDGALCPARLPWSLHQPVQVPRLDPANHAVQMIASVTEHRCPRASPDLLSLLKTQGAPPPAPPPSGPSPVASILILTLAQNAPLPKQFLRVSSPYPRSITAIIQDTLGTEDRSTKALNWQTYSKEDNSQNSLVSLKTR